MANAETYAEKAQVDENKATHDGRNEARAELKSSLLGLVENQELSDPKAFAEHLKELGLLLEEEFENKTIEQMRESANELIKYLNGASSGVINIVSSDIQESVAEVGMADKEGEKSREVLEAEALEKYKAEYNRIPEERSRLCPWEKVLSRLGKLGKDDKSYLTLAMDLTGGGELVDIDDKGNPLFTHVGGEAYMLRANYKTAREAVYGKDYNPKKKPHRGYEMANNVQEIRRIETHTGRAFVHDPKNEEYRASWLESGENSSVARCARSDPISRDANIFVDNYPADGSNLLGVVRLLRVLE